MTPEQLDEIEAHIRENEKKNIFAAPVIMELVTAVRALRAEVADLQMMRDEHLLDNMHATDEGRDLERAAVVAWLRREAAVEGASPDERQMARCAARTIERGEHRRKEEP